MIKNLIILACLSLQPLLFAQVNSCREFYSKHRDILSSDEGKINEKQFAEIVQEDLKYCFTGITNRFGKKVYYFYDYDKFRNEENNSANSLQTKIVDTSNNCKDLLTKYPEKFQRSGEDYRVYTAGYNFFKKDYSHCFEIRNVNDLQIYYLLGKSKTPSKTLRQTPEKNESVKTDTKNSNISPHLCAGGPMSDRDSNLTIHPKTGQVLGEFSYLSNSGPDYVVPYLNEDRYPTLHSSELSGDKSNLSTGHMTDNEKTDLESARTGIESLQAVSQYAVQSTANAADNLNDNKNVKLQIEEINKFQESITFQGFYNAVNNSKKFGAAAHEDLNPNNGVNGYNGVGPVYGKYTNKKGQKVPRNKYLYSTRQCSFYYYNESKRITDPIQKKRLQAKHVRELCGRVELSKNLNLSYPEDQKKVAATLSATFLNLVLMSSYGPNNGGRVFIPHKDIIQMQKSSPLKNLSIVQYLSKTCDSENKYDFVSDSAASFKYGFNSKHPNSYAGNASKPENNKSDCMITIEDLAQLFASGKGFPEWEIHSPDGGKFIDSTMPSYKITRYKNHISSCINRVESETPQKKSGVVK